MSLIFPTHENCLICLHPLRHELEAAMEQGWPLRRISREYGPSVPTLKRHREHMRPPPRAVRAHTSQGEAAPDGAPAQAQGGWQSSEVTARLLALYERASRLLDKIERERDWRSAVGAIREARETLALIAELLGELDRTPAGPVVYQVQWIDARGNHYAP